MISIDCTPLFVAFSPLICCSYSFLLSHFVFRVSSSCNPTHYAKPGELHVMAQSYHTRHAVMQKRTRSIRETWNGFRLIRGDREGRASVRTEKAVCTETFPGLSMSTISRRRRSSRTYCGIPRAMGGIPRSVWSGEWKETRNVTGENGGMLLQGVL